jgi:hypothetical protein
MEAREELYKMCREFLNSYLLDENNPDITKSEILKKLYSIPKEINRIKVEFSTKDKCYSKEFRIRHNRNEYPELYIWRKEVLKRDNYTCQECGKTKKLQVHHINSWAEYPFERFNIENGQTLCRKCHSKTNNYGWKNNAIC